MNTKGNRVKLESVPGDFVAIPNKEAICLMNPKTQKFIEMPKTRFKSLLVDNLVELKEGLTLKQFKAACIIASSYHHIPFEFPADGYFLDASGQSVDVHVAIGNALK